MSPYTYTSGNQQSKTIPDLLPDGSNYAEWNRAIVELPAEYLDVPGIASLGIDQVLYDLILETTDSLIQEEHVRQYFPSTHELLRFIRDICEPKPASTRYRLWERLFANYASDKVPTQVYQNEMATRVEAARIAGIHVSDMVEQVLYFNGLSRMKGDSPSTEADSSYRNQKSQPSSEQTCEDEEDIRNIFEYSMALNVGNGKFRVKARPPYDTELAIELALAQTAETAFTNETPTQTEQKAFKSSIPVQNEQSSVKISTPIKKEENSVNRMARVPREQALSSPFKNVTPPQRERSSSQRLTSATTEQDVSSTSKDEIPAQIEQGRTFNPSVREPSSFRKISRAQARAMDRDRTIVLLDDNDFEQADSDDECWVCPGLYV